MQPGEICSICELQPEDLLVLVCQHNLCVNCATEVYAINDRPNPFVCQICLTETDLDEETIAQLTMLTDRQATASQSQPARKPPKSKRKQGDQLPTSPHSVCQIHQESTLYYCFNCQTHEICPQCILTTKHAGHNVVTFKKAVNLVLQKIEEKVVQKQAIRDRIAGSKSKYIACRKQVSNDIKERKSELKDVFDEIIRTVTEQYAVLCQQLEEEGFRVNEMLSGCINEIEEKVTLLKESIQIEKHFSEMGREQEMFVYFAKINSENLGIFEPKLPRTVPVFDPQIVNVQQARRDITKSLAKIGLRQKLERQDTENNDGPEIEFSVIQPEPIDLAAELEIHTAFKEGCKQAQSYQNSYSYNKSSSCKSRKLELSRSIDNATNIINKLQERSRNL